MHPQLNLNWAEWSWRQCVGTEICVRAAVGLKSLARFPEQVAQEEQISVELNSHSWDPDVYTIYTVENLVWTTFNLTMD